MIFLTQSIAYFYWFGWFSDLLVTSKVRVRMVAMMTLRSDQQGDKIKANDIGIQASKAVLQLVVAIKQWPNFGYGAHAGWASATSILLAADGVLEWDVARRPGTNQPSPPYIKLRRAHSTVPEAEVAGKARPHPAVLGDSRQRKLGENAGHSAFLFYFAWSTTIDIVQVWFD